MGLTEFLLGKMSGQLHFYVFVGKTKLAEIGFEEKKKEIIVDIKSPVTAVKFGLDEYLKNKDKMDSKTLDKIKKMGYKLKIRYKMLEFEV